MFYKSYTIKDIAQRKLLYLLKQLGIKTHKAEGVLSIKDLDRVLQAGIENFGSPNSMSMSDAEVDALNKLWEK